MSGFCPTGADNKTRDKGVTMAPRLNYNPMRLLAVAALLMACTTITVRADDNLQTWENFDFGKNAIKSEQIRNFTLEDLKLLRGIVFGRHGRVFKDAEIRTYLEAR